MVSEHEEPLFVAMEALKSLVHSYIDESLIKQGVDQIMENTRWVHKGLGQLSLKKCATVESLLDYRYGSVWDMSFQVVSRMFDKLGDSSYLLRKTLTSLADMQKLPDEDFPCRKQVTGTRKMQRVSREHIQRVFAEQEMLNSELEKKKVEPFDMGNEPTAEDNVQVASSNQMSSTYN